MPTEPDTLVPEDESQVDSAAEAEDEKKKSTKGYQRPASPAASPLTRPGDAAARPGFRSPTNQRSKAQRKKKKKKKR